MVPRAELEAAMTNMNTLSQQLTEERQAREADKKAQRDQAINAALDKAITDRKILPTSRAYYLSQCQAEGGLEAFQAHVDSLPQMLADSGLDNAPPPSGNAGNGGAEVTLTDKEKEVAANMGVEPEKFLETKKANAARRHPGQPPAL